MATVDTSANKENNDVQNETTKPTEDPIVPNGDNKEQEEPSKAAPITTTTTTKQPDDEKEASLLSEGIKLMEKEDYSSATKLFSDALQILQQKNIATSIEAAPYYLAYGEALLRLVQSQNDLFAAPAPQPPQEQQEVETATAENEENTKEEQEEEEQKEAMRVSGNGDVDTSEDREIAWETLEYARSIIQEFLELKGNENDNEKLKMLANVHSFLGEICIEDENNEMALIEFETALKLQSECKEGVIKCREKAFNHFYASLAAQFSEKDDDALRHCNVALNELSQRIKALLKELGCDEIESKEHNELIEIAQGFMDKMDEIKKNGEDGKELNKLVGISGDLVSKLEEIEDGIKRKKEQKDKGEENENKNNLNMNEVASDPLTALINGLSARFGIDEAELAKLEALDNEQNENKNKKNEKAEGVTTIGFGTGNVEEDDAECFELGSFGTSKKEKKNEEIKEVKEVKKVTVKRKRKLNETDIEIQDENTKKIKLNSGAAVVAEKEKEENAK